MYVPRNPYFSDFSFGYAVTEDLVLRPGSPIRIAPIFPSLIEEGGLGFDVFIDRPSVPLFLQFKLAHCMVRKNAREAKLGDFVPPFYRLHLRTTGENNQHRLLLDLEAGNQQAEVFYVAPGFHTRDALNDAYENRQVWNRSFHIKPSEIGALSDAEHHVAFQMPGSWRPYSEEPRAKGKTSNPEVTLDLLAERLRSAKPASLRQQISQIDEAILKIFRMRKQEFREWRVSDTTPLETKLEPLRRVSYLARHFDSQLFVAIQR